MIEGLHQCNAANPQSNLHAQNTCFYVATLKVLEAGSFVWMVSLVWVDVADLQLKLAQMWRLRSLRWLIPVLLCLCASQHFAYSSKTQLQSKFLSQNSCKHFWVKARSLAVSVEYSCKRGLSCSQSRWCWTVSEKSNSLMITTKFIKNVPCRLWSLWGHPFFFLSADVWSHLDHRMFAMELDHTMSRQQIKHIVTLRTAAQLMDV